MTIAAHVAPTPSRTNINVGSAPSRPTYIMGVDGLRAIAVLSVMIYHLHAAWLPGGFVGVDVFFVISGYVVARSLARHDGEHFGSFIVAFYARRVLRIFPALLACLVVTIAFCIAFIPESWLSNAVQLTSLRAFYGMSNFALVATSDGYFAPRAEFNAFTHTWSLAVEEQFYALFPLIFWIWLQQQRRVAVPRWSPLLLLLPIALSLAWCVYSTAATPDRAYYMLAPRFWELGVGAALGVLWTPRDSNVSRVASPRTFIAVGLVLIGVSLCFADARHFPFPWAIPSVVGSGLVLVGLSEVTQPSGPLTEWLASNAMTRIGLLSYSLYLWHWPIFVAFRWTVGLESPLFMAIALLLTYAAAWLSRTYIELPFQRDRRIARLPRWVVVTTGVAVVAGGSMVAQRLWWREQRLSRSVVMRNASIWYPEPADRVSPNAAPECRVTISSTLTDGDYVQQFVPSGCMHKGELAHLFAVGDSHAGAYGRMLHQLAEQTGTFVTLYTHGGCGVANLRETLTDEGAACVRFSAASLADVRARAKPGDVILLASIRAERLGDQQGTRTDVNASPTTDSVRALTARARADADLIVGSLVTKGLRVVIDAPKPVFPSPPFRCADWYDKHNPVCAAGFTVSRAVLDSMQRPVRESLRSLAMKYPTLTVWDPQPILCPDAVCSASRNGVPLFFDGDHLSGFGNELLLPSFRRMMTSELRQ
jgi:peptidoglycan/LPS O-acetylase OafA/YrhL